MHVDCLCWNLQQRRKKKVWGDPSGSSETCPLSMLLLRLSVPNPKEALRKHETNSYTTRFVSNGKLELENEIGIKWENNKVRQHVTVEKIQLPQFKPIFAPYYLCDSGQLLNLSEVHLLIHNMEKIPLSHGLHWTKTLRLWAQCLAVSRHSFNVGYDDDRLSEITRAM